MLQRLSRRADQSQYLCRWLVSMRLLAGSIAAPQRELSSSPSTVVVNPLLYVVDVVEFVVLIVVWNEDEDYDPAPYAAMGDYCVDCFGEAEHVDCMDEKLDG